MMNVSKNELAQQRLELRQKLLGAGVATARFNLEESNGGAFQSFQAEFVDRQGARIVDAELTNAALQVIVSWVDAQVPGWSADDGGRSQIDWAIEVDAFQHQHFDSVKFERRRLLDAASDMAASSQILADNARAALLLAMGDLAPTDRSAQQHLRVAAKIVMDQSRTDQVHFLSDAQRDLLIEGIAGTRLKHGNEQEWVTEAVTYGYVGYEHAPDVDLVQKLATESLDEVVEGICGPLHITAGSEREQKTRHALIAALTLPQSLEALNAIAEDWGDAMLSSLPEADEIEPEAAGHDAPSA